MIDIIKWHKDNGGFHGRLAAHALRLLGEAIELCIVLGTTPDEIRKVGIREIDKAEDRNEFGTPKTKGQIAGEFADVSFLFTVLAHHAKVDIAKAEAIKYPILLHREWEADIDGVLWRPGMNPNPENVATEEEAHKNAKYGKAIK